ncbi:YihY/virulence factor BrkB family protein [Anaerosphaera multitolerans]|uniref:YihY/virulence factor BrkB family protein n=1 Tax=Anaerosphaera multitolerans TaxID=2487351 RepID=A0A437S920_9FIRM|nr:YihY/virulence factor BrkB family protein [Anaerosphaera multitolerans]RVU55603.1 YihY/virulence factor BrkB family protein [Anaerosphaera multitolerans]
MLKFINKFIEKHQNNSIFIFFDKLIYRFFEHRIFEISGSLVYFTILSMFPFLIALLNAINFTNILSSEALLEYLEYLPQYAKDIIISFLNEISTKSSGGLFSISVIAGLWTSSTVIKQIMKNINLAYGSKDKRNYIKAKAIAVFFTLALIVMIMLLLLTQVFGDLIVTKAVSFFDLNNEVISLWNSLSLFIPIIYIIIILFLLYRFSLDPKLRSHLRFKIAIPGAIIATFSAILVTKFFGYYVIHFSNYSITYGSLGSIIVLLIWIWLMNMIILLGAEINAVLFSMYVDKNTDLIQRKESVLKNFIIETDE